MTLYQYLIVFTGGPTLSFMEFKTITLGDIDRLKPFLP